MIRCYSLGYTDFGLALKLDSLDLGTLGHLNLDVLFSTIFQLPIFADLIALF